MRTLAPDQRRVEAREILSGTWPHFPIIPVVRHGDGDNEAGLIAWVYVEPPKQDRTVRVYRANLWVIASEAKGKTWADALEGVPTIDYPTLDAFFDAGWRVD